MSEGKLLSCDLPGADSKLIYVEYGAGKAGLSSFVAMGLEDVHKQTEFDKSKVKFLVIDRDSRRFKKDKIMKAIGFEVER